jgi:hypothetical protein
MRRASVPIPDALPLRQFEVSLRREPRAALFRAGRGAFFLSKRPEQLRAAD